MSRAVSIAVEGLTDAAVARRLLDEAGCLCEAEYVRGGKVALDQRLAAYNNAARFSCWLVLRDLDRDDVCAPALARTLLPSPAAHMRFHVAVRAVEAWLIGDAESLSAFLSVSPGRLPRDPESLPNPKDAVVSMARHSRRRAIRDALVPRLGTTARIGPGYPSVLIEFAARKWRPEVAEKRCPSLASLRRFLRARSPRR